MPTDTRNPLSQLDPDDLQGSWSRLGFEQMSDGDLLRATTELLAVPHQEPADSFTLHAPLELMARAQMLPAVSRDRREATRQRIANIAATWTTTGTAATAAVASPVESPLDALAGALSDGDPGAVDRAFIALCAQHNRDEIIGDLADVVLPHLGGAAHGAIFLELLPRFRPNGIDPMLMARTLLGDLARHPDWRLSWFTHPRPGPYRHDRRETLTERLVSPKADGEPSSHFVQPTMALVDESGLAYHTLADVTDGLTIGQAREELLVIAGMSMLQDEPANAPYGWTHCLTLPRAALAVAERASDPQRAVDVAATYVLGFRATQSSGPIDLAWEPDPPATVDAREIMASEPSAAAALAWHATGQRRAHITQQLIDHAAAHHDAHLAKYTLACLDAGARDGANAHLYLAAAAHLAAWWHHHDQSNGATS